MSQALQNFFCDYHSLCISVSSFHSLYFPLGIYFLFFSADVVSIKLPASHSTLFFVEFWVLIFHKLFSDNEFFSDLS